MPSDISIKDIGYAYPNGTVALDGLSIEIEAGKVTGIVGPSGCGKSTLLRLIAGLASPTSGQIVVSGEARDRHPLTMVFQQDTLLPWLTVRDNVGLFYRFNRAPKSDVRERVDALLGLAGLEAFSNAYPYQLSGGMRRRTAFLAGVAPQPHVLLLDEPFSSVDEPSRIGIHKQVLEIIHRLHITTVLVTHDLAEAVSLSDQVAIISARPGRVAVLHEIPFGDDRNVFTLRQRPEFLELYGQLWRGLSEQIARSGSAEDDLPQVIRAPR
jgi:NitT/TauT family transport system ATP-binding protein